MILHFASFVDKLVQKKTWKFFLFPRCFVNRDASHPVAFSFSRAQRSCASDSVSAGKLIIFCPSASPK